MKTKLLAALTAATLCFTQVKAADLCVNENGNGGCYSTISAAISAAVNGDRILITPKTGNAPYVENLNINKTVQLLCAVDTARYTVQGAVSVVPANGRTVTIIGMILQGDIAPTTSNAAGTRCVFNLLGSNITGNINFEYDNFNVLVASNYITGYVNLRYGKVIGNNITTNSPYYWYSAYGSCVYVGTDATPTNDTVFIVGNVINHNMNANYVTGIEFNSTNQYTYIANNLIRFNQNSAVTNRGIDMYQYKNSAFSRNWIINNTITSQFGINTGLSFNTAPSNAYTDVVNNLVIAPSALSGGIYNANGTVGIYFNMMNLGLVNCTSVINSNNTITSNTTVDAAGRPMVGSDAINGGSGDFSYYDVDLTVNDAGAYGGSLTLDNFFPLTGSARVFMVYAPRRVNVSGTINIKADSFDR